MIKYIYIYLEFPRQNVYPIVIYRFKIVGKGVFEIRCICVRVWIPLLVRQEEQNDNKKDIGCKFLQHFFHFELYQTLLSCFLKCSRVGRLEFGVRLFTFRCNFCKTETSQICSSSHTMVLSPQASSKMKEKPVDYRRWHKLCLQVITTTALLQNSANNSERGDIHVPSMVPLSFPINSSSCAAITLFKSSFVSSSSNEGFFRIQAMNATKNMT